MNGTMTAHPSDFPDILCSAIPQFLVPPRLGVEESVVCARIV